MASHCFSGIQMVFNMTPQWVSSSLREMDMDNETPPLKRSLPRIILEVLSGNIKKKQKTQTSQSTGATSDLEVLILIPFASHSAANCWRSVPSEASRTVSFQNSKLAKLRGFQLTLSTTHRHLPATHGHLINGAYRVILDLISDLSQVTLFNKPKAITSKIVLGFSHSTFHVGPWFHYWLLRSRWRLI